MTICRICKKKHATFNYIGMKARFCAEHKTDDMIDVRSPLCRYPKCKYRACFNILGLNAQYCRVHKTNDMINVAGKRCVYPDCRTNPRYNVPGGMRKYCAEHKTDDMINVKSKHCVGQEGTCMTLVGRSYRGYCLHCFMHTFPNEPVLQNYKTKEKVVVDRIKSHFPDFVWRHDREVECGTSRRRPDLLLDVGSHVLIIEIDEDSHESYDCSCENKRLMQLSVDVSRIHFPEIIHRDIVLIRFNPDKYTDADGQVHKSCFYRNKRGVVVLAKTSEWEHRIAELIKTVQFWITAKPERTMLLLHLFMTQLS